jgi:hypothetical protein
MTNYENHSQWRTSQNGSDFCRFEDLKEAIRSRLQQENKFTATIDNYRYTVKDYDGKWLVFRRDLRGTQKSHNKRYRNLVEIRVFTLDEANKRLNTDQNSFELFGSDPVKVINNKVCVVMAKYNHQSERKYHKETLEQVVGPECPNVNQIQLHQLPRGSLDD